MVVEHETTKPKVLALATGKMTFDSRWPVQQHYQSDGDQGE